ncbi:hypothetical protein CLIB1423_21S00122 [[Candida] railenensis]|uniref:Uncharacterized protein n=1 Tax=[Candida] railenensis TaxID=45579 RepID=A0A9P0QU63_9ASCO|nr:hypothetical protein CLIB1423_21S00122 [[Candida] railenensis]
MNYAYEEYLKNPDVSQFASFSHVDESGRLATKMPTAVEAGSHLILLHAFHKLYKDASQRFSWKVYVTNAIRRFLIFLGAYRSSRVLDVDDESDINIFFSYGNKAWKTNVLYTLLPPLDILMIWHAYLLNPKSYYDFCARNKVLDFAFTPFPLIEVVSAIDKASFEFKPSLSQYAGFQNLIKDYGTDLEYDVSKIENAMDVHCSLCFKVIASPVPYTNEEHTGFADAGLLAPGIQNKGCPVCNKRSTVTHEELRKRQLQADIIRNTILPNCYKYFSSVVSNTLYRVDKPQMVTKQVKDLIQAQPDIIETSMNIPNLISKLITNQKEIRNIEVITYILRTYAQLNPIHLLISSPDRIELSDDLVGMVVRQQRYIQEVISLNWLRSSQLINSLSSAEDRYKKFMELYVTTRYRILIPTIDIDLFWKTHLLSLYNYFSFCKESKADCVIDHYDKIEESRLFFHFQDTAQLFFTRFKEHYSDCTCCKTKINSKKSIARVIFRKKKQTAHEISDMITLSHISTHKAIRITSDSAEKARLGIPVNSFKRIQAEMEGNWVISIDEPYSRSELKFRTGGANNLVVTEGDGGSPREGVDQIWGKKQTLMNIR